MKKYFTSFLPVLLGIAFAVSPLWAAPIVSDGADQAIYENGESVWVGQSTHRVGFDSATRMGVNPILVFALPTLAAGESITTASLSINVTVAQGVFGGESDWNIDVYGVRASDSPTVLTTDFFGGANDGSATKVIDDFITILGDTPAATGNYSTGTAAFGSWLNTLYTGSTPNNTYAFVRLNADVTFAEYGAASRFLTLDSANSATEAFKPTLTITTAIPEPATLALVLISLGGLLLFRRRSFNNNHL